MSLPLALLLMVLMGAGFWCWLTLRAWHMEAVLQIRLDRCTGRKVFWMRKQLKEVRHLNQALVALRVGTPLTALNPVAATLAGLGKGAIVARQTWIQVDWRARQLKGLFGDCDLKGAHVRLPSWPYMRPPPDALGPRPLRWWGGRKPNTLRVWALRRPRTSVAELQNNNNQWEARWVSPLSPFLSGGSLGSTRANPL